VGNFDADDAVVETLGGEAVHHAEKWSGASQCGGGSEKNSGVRGWEGNSVAAPAELARGCRRELRFA